MVVVQAEKLRRYCQDLFEKVGVPTDEAYRNADNLVDADLKGVESHGVSRMAVYLKRLRLGLVRPDARLEIISETPGTALIDACNSMGASGSYKVMEKAIEKAKTTGISFITVRNSNHYSAAAYFAQMALEHDMVGFTASNGPARVAPWGGKDPMFGTSPFAVAIPAGNRLPIIVDMATCVVARGKIILAAKKGEPIPLGWARNKDGEDTTNAKEALEGTVLPFGGPKGYAISTIIETLTGILAGSAFTNAINDLNADFENPSFTSHYFGAIKIAAFQDPTEFKDNMDKFIDSVKANPRGKDVAEIFLPGEIEQRMKIKRQAEGIPLADVTVGELKHEGEELGVLCDL
jgi:LDH2 family malate/lactate/ureidoglycolate dehydrogenase